VLQTFLDARAATLSVAVEHLSKADRAPALALGYETNLLIFAAVTAVAAAIWLGADADRPLAASAAQIKR
jgi:hypothetical protein